MSGDENKNPSSERWMGITQLSKRIETSPHKAKIVLESLGLWDSNLKIPTSKAFAQGFAQARRSQNESRSERYGNDIFFIWRADLLESDLKAAAGQLGGGSPSIAVGGRNGAERKLNGSVFWINAIAAKDRGLAEDEDFKGSLGHVHMAFFWIICPSKNRAVARVCDLIEEAFSLIKTLPPLAQSEAIAPFEQMKDVLRWAKRLRDWQDDSSEKMNTETRRRAARALKLKI